MDGAGGTGGAGGQAGGPSDAGSLCPITSLTLPPLASPHVAACSVVNYATNPPTSGPHYPTWAAFKWYDTPVPRGFWVHSMEHGAVVIGYRCEGGCEADLVALAAFLEARPADPLCVAPLKSRIIVTPDPELDTRFGVSAWGSLMKSDCLDLAALGVFLDEHYGKAPENFCVDGVDVTTPDAGYPADCGMATDAGTDGG